MTPIEVTSRYPGRSGRMEVWSARSTDGLWTYEREESAGTPWVVTYVPSGGSDLFGSLPKARKFTARPTAIAWFAQIAEETARCRAT
jgi:hypothetical protein